MLQPLTSHVVGRGAAPAALPHPTPPAAAHEPSEFDVDAILGQRGFYFSERTLPLISASSAASTSTKSIRTSTLSSSRSTSRRSPS